MKKLTKLFILPLAILTLAGCGKVAVLENGQEAVATTDEGNISAEDLYEKLKTTYGKSVLTDLIDNVILDAKYEETDEENEYIEKQIDSLKENATQSNVTYEYLINYYGFENNEEVEKYFRLTYRRQTAVEDYLSKNITDKEIENYYKNSIYGDIKVKHILIEADILDGMTTEEQEEALSKALKTAKDVIKKLKNGEDFDKLAKEYSDDTSTSSKGGDLGWINTDEMEDAFEEKAFALEKEKYTTTPVQTSYGYHIIYKTDEKDKPKLKDVKEEIISTLVKEKLSADATLYYTTLEDIREKSGLKIEDSKLKSAYDEYMKDLISKANSSSTSNS